MSKNPNESHEQQQQGLLNTIKHHVGRMPSIDAAGALAFHRILQKLIVSNEPYITDVWLMSRLEGACSQLYDVYLMLYEDKPVELVLRHKWSFAHNFVWFILPDLTECLESPANRGNLYDDLTNNSGQ
jgi:hypothetical protein